MAIELMDEHEKGEHVRAWLRQNGSAIVTGVALGLAAIFGWQWWQGSQSEHRVTASIQYQALTEAVERNELDTVAAMAEELEREYSDTTFAVLAALQLGDARAQAGDMKGAVAALEKAGQLTKDPALAGISRLRAARLILTSGDAEAALAQLDAMPAGMYAGFAAEVKGDALSVLGRAAEARDAYAEALTQLDTGAPNRRIVEMKLADLGGDTSAPEA
jgi:predicted negative regulator of RcsB-dependent stress response